MTDASISRRSLLAATTLFAAWTIAGRTVQAQQVDTDDFKDMKPGQYTWNPERSPEGPVAIIVSIPDQRVYVYRNGIRIAVSTCSTGKPGHATPTGVFSILQKDKDHHSDEYNDAPMPNMNRLTWSGVALHAGAVRGPKLCGDGITALRQDIVAFGNGTMRKFTVALQPARAFEGAGPGEGFEAANQRQGDSGDRARQQQRLRFPWDVTEQAKNSGGEIEPGETDGGPQLGQQAFKRDAGARPDNILGDAAVQRISRPTSREFYPAR